MTDATIMIQLEQGQSNINLLYTAVDFAARFESNVIGIVVSQPTQMMYADYYVSEAIVEHDMHEMEAQLHAAKTEFEEAFKSHTGPVT